MAASDDFKKAIQAGRFDEALVLALGNAVELNITTWVASATDAAPTAAEPGHRLHTRINLIGGEIENEVGDRFIGNGPYTELQQFHHQQVLEGNKTIQKNLQSLSALFRVLIALKQHQANPDEPLTLPDIDIPALGGTVATATPTETPTVEPVSTPPRDTWENLAVVADLTPEVQPSREPTSIPEIPTPPPPEDPVSELEIEDWEGVSTPRPEETPEVAIADEEVFTAADLPLSPAPTEPETPEAPIDEAVSPDNEIEDWNDDDFDQIATEISETAPPVLDLPSTPDSDEDDWDVFDEEASDEITEAGSLALDIPEESWDELEETTPTETPPIPQTESLDLESEDWGDFEDSSTPETTETSDLGLSAEEDWDELEETPSTETPSTPQTELLDLESEDWGDFENISSDETPAEVDAWDADTEVGSLEENSQGEFDLLDSSTTDPLASEETESPFVTPPPAISNDEEEWEGDWLNESSPFAEDTAPESEVVDLGSEEEWEDFESLDPFASPSTEGTTASSPDLVEDWDDFAPEELEPYPKSESFGGDSELDSLNQAESEPTDAIAMPPPAENWDETDWSDETVFGSDFADDDTDEEDDDLFSGLTAIQKKPETPEDESSSNE